MKKSPHSRIGSFFGAVFSVLTHNWGLKIIALALAILVYYSIKLDSASKRYNDRTFFQQSP